MDNLAKDFKNMNLLTTNKKENESEDEDDDFQPKQQVNTSIDQSNVSKSTISGINFDNQPKSNQNVPEFSITNNYSANNQNNGQVDDKINLVQDEEEKDAEIVKQTAKTLTETIDSDLNKSSDDTTYLPITPIDQQPSLTSTTPQQAVRQAMVFQQQQQQNYFSLHGGITNALNNAFQSQNRPRSQSLLAGQTPIPVIDEHDNQPQQNQLQISNNYQAIIPNISSHLPASNVIREFANLSLKNLAANKVNPGNTNENNDTNNNDNNGYNDNNRYNNNWNYNGASGNGRNNDDDSGRNNDDGDRNNGNQDRNNPPNPVDNNANGITTAINLLAKTQETLVELMKKKRNEPTYKLPKCDIKYYGVLKNGKKDDLMIKMWEVTNWCKLKGINADKMFDIWMSDVLQDPAKSVIYQQADYISNFETLIEILITRYPIEPKIFQRLKEFRAFTYVKKTSMREHINKYSVIIGQIIQEKWIWEKIIRRNRAPELPSLESQYKVLLNSIRKLDKIYYKVLELMIMKNNKINNSEYRIQEKDINTLADQMIIAEKIIYPEDQLVRFDQTKQLAFSHGGGRRRDRRTNSRRTYPARNQQSRRNRRTRQDQRRLNYQQQRSQFRGRCFACNGTHPVRTCQNKQAKTKYCRENKLCLFCAKPGHTIKECNDKKEWLKKKEAGNGNGQQNGKPKPKPKQYNRAAIRFHKHCSFGDECKYEDDCHYVHPGDYEIVNHDNAANGVRTERMQKLFHKPTRKERMHVKSSLEIVRMDKYQLSPEEIPEEEKVVIHLKKDETSLVRFPALLDGGSTITAVIPRIGDKMQKECGIKLFKDSQFLVENGSGKDVIFSGEYLIIPTLIPNTKEFVKIKYYIMPHNECAYGIILGLTDSKSINYKQGLEVEDGKVLFRHRGKRRYKKMKHIESANRILDRMQELPNVALKNSNIEMYQKQDALEEEDSSAEYDSDSSQGTSDELTESDDDSEDGSRSY